MLNLHALTEIKLITRRTVFYKFRKDRKKILLGAFNSKLLREDIFKLTARNESLHEHRNDNGARVVNFATSKNLFLKSTMFLHINLSHYTWTSTDVKNHNQIPYILIENTWL